MITALNVEKGDEVSAGSGSFSSASTLGSGTSSAMSSLSAMSALSGSTALSASSGSSSGLSGASSSSSALTISNYTKSMKTTVDISESDISSVKEGMDVNLTFDAFPSLTATGTVSQVSPTGSSSNGLVNFTVQITLKSPDARLRPGMNTTAEIILEESADVLRVPNTAISEETSGNATVQVAVGGSTENLKRVPVTLGIADDSFTEVISGLSEGDEVVSGVTNGLNNILAQNGFTMNDDGTMQMPQGGGPMGGGGPNREQNSGGQTPGGDN